MLVASPVSGARFVSVSTKELITSGWSPLLDILSHELTEMSGHGINMVGFTNPERPSSNLYHNLDYKALLSISSILPYDIYIYISYLINIVEAIYIIPHYDSKIVFPNCGVQMFILRQLLFRPGRCGGLTKQLSKQMTCHLPLPSPSRSADDGIIASRIQTVVNMKGASCHPSWSASN